MHMQSDLKFMNTHIYIYVMRVCICVWPHVLRQNIMIVRAYGRDYLHFWVETRQRV